MIYRCKVGAEYRQVCSGILRSILDNMCPRDAAISVEGLPYRRRLFRL